MNSTITNLSDDELLSILESIRWKNIPISPFDNSSPVYKCTNGRYRCKNTGKYFNVLTNTIFHGSRLPLNKWLRSVEILRRDPNLSGVQLASEIETSVPTATRVLSKLRKSLKLYKSKSNVNSIEVKMTNFDLAYWLQMLK